MKKTIYFTDSKLFDEWADAVKLGLIPGENVSARLMELIRQDVSKSAGKIRKHKGSVYLPEPKPRDRLGF